MKINYVIASYAGKRRRNNPDYLKKHLKRLFELKHDLDQITIVRPNPSLNRFGEISEVDDSKEYYDLGEYADKVVILDRPVNDRSFGQYLFAYKTYGLKFDAYIFTEDDYFPNVNNFDMSLALLLNQSDYVCTYFNKWGYDSDPCVIIPNGIVRSSALETIFNNTDNYDHIFEKVDDGQEIVLFEGLFKKHALKITDYSHIYPAIYYHRENMWFTFHGETTSIFVPYQILYPE